MCPHSSSNSHESLSRVGLPAHMSAHTHTADMIEVYKAAWSENEQRMDEKLLSEMQSKKEAELNRLAEAKEKALKEEGEVEVHDIELERSAYLGKSGSLQDAIASYASVGAKLTSGKNIDKHLSILRLCLAWKDDEAYKKHAEATGKLIEKGGDWDRRNRFTVYNGVHHFRTRNLKGAAEAWLDAIATFTASEVFDYRTLVYYTVIAAVVSLPRTLIKSSLIDKPEIRQVINDLKELKEFLHAFYECRYAEFYKALLHMMHYIRNDSFLSIHADYYLREIRLRAYQQFLKSYLSVTLDTVAKEFGVSSEFVDSELSSYIASNRLSCKIDKVKGIVEMKRVDQRNQHYQEIIRKGDLLLNRVQRLSRIVTY